MAAEWFLRNQAVKSVHGFESPPPTAHECGARSIPGRLVDAGRSCLATSRKLVPMTSKRIYARDRRMAAVHEAGHFVIARAVGIETSALCRYCCKSLFGGTNEIF